MAEVVPAERDATRPEPTAGDHDAGPGPRQERLRVRVASKDNSLPRSEALSTLRVGTVDRKGSRRDPGSTDLPHDVRVVSPQPAPRARVDPARLDDENWARSERAKQVRARQVGSGTAGHHQDRVGVRREPSDPGHGGPEI